MAAAVLSALSIAATPGREPAIAFDLPAGPAGAGLRTIAQLAGVPLVARPGDLVGRNGPALKGRMPLRTALERWCGGAGLDCRHGPDGIVVRARHRVAARRARSVAPPATVDPPGSPPPDIVVTGRRGITSRPAQTRSYSATHIDAAALARRQPDALADMLAAVPGLWVDPSAGTAANTVRVRGLPLDGYQALAVQEDGLPVQHDTLPWSDIDQFVRPDLMIDSADYVRGGPSSIHASNAPGGILNLRTRSPDATGGAARITLSDRGLARVEGYRSGAIGAWRAIVGGGVTRDPGVRRIAATLGGWQARVRAERPVGGDGRLTLSARMLDDDTLNISSFPLRRTGSGVAPLPGFDPRRDSWFGPDLAQVAFAAAGVRPVARNNRNRLFAATATLAMPVGEWRVTGRLRARRSRTHRYAISTSGAPVRAQAAIDGATPRLAAAFPTLAQVAVRRAVDGSAFAPLAGNDLVETVNPVAADVRLSEAIGDLTAARVFDLAGRHDVTLGLYGVTYRWRFDRAVARALIEARGQGRLLDLVALDAGRRVVGSLTDRGFLSRGTTHETIDARQRMAALHAADEWNLTERLRIDTGVRVEALAIDAMVGQPRRIDGGDPATLADDALAVPSGRSRPAQARVAAGSATAALHWRPTPALGLFARTTRASRLPDPGVFRTGLAAPRATHVDQRELGLLWRTGAVSLDATLFASRFGQIGLETLAIDPQTGAIVPARTEAFARTLGVEIDARWRVGSALAVDLAATVQDPRLGDYRIDERIDGVPVRSDLSGRIPRRVPRAMARLSLSGTVPQTPLTLDLDVTAMGRRFADDANTLALPPFAILDLGVRWQVRDGMTLRLAATNVLDAIAVMQGDAIGGEVRAPATPVFVGRAQQGRIVEAGVTWRF
ncbi:TonB-dependent receptor [Sphingomonas silueang]|uniref:TonB-dependent receptor n=1 Tax=Sphingomonas silueang TaxID=3156617 RepID=UPI0032B4A1EB